ncbi:MAG: hypothetical protein JXA03_10865 [Bacteroidales bacterium]|nr:hypothetical protein [Bacteroidales bacterium]
MDAVHDFKITLDRKELNKSQDEILELPQSISIAPVKNEAALLKAASF